MQRCTACCTGLRNSSTGVPMVTMTGPRRLIALGDEVKISRLFASALAQQRRRAVLDERQLAGAQRRQHRLVEIVDVDGHPGFGEGQHQRNADMAGAADHGEVGLRRPALGRRVGLVDGLFKLRCP